MKHLLPAGWPRPRGYSNGIQADGEQVFVAGMIGWNEAEEVADGFVAQLDLALRNTVAVLAEAGAGPEHVTRMTWYVKGLDEYRENIPEVGQTYREIMGKNFHRRGRPGRCRRADRDRNNGRYRERLTSGSDLYN
jgi:enamine deaminase RidA (YjgF/YER057c/UK114 family)